jgi:macrolide transport system ATP-binding/permease protein
VLREPDLARIRSERLGFVFQSFNLLARTSAIENVGLPLYYAASGPKGRAVRLERARAALHLLGLGDRERNTPGQLSGGQQQRVAIARALINAPSLLLADEPTGNLDTRTSHEIMETLVSLNREQGVTIVLVTHELDIAAYTDRIVTMRDGTVISDERVTKPAASAAAPNGERSAFFHPPEQRASTLPAGDFLGFALMILVAAAQAIGRNKMRSALTMLGVFIGVAALIVMVAVGDGASEAVRKQIESLGTNVVDPTRGAQYGRHPCRVRQRQHAHGWGCARDSPGGSCGRTSRLPHPPAGAGAVQQPELDDEHPRRKRSLSVDHELADRRRAGHHGRGREQIQPRRRYRTNGVPSAL